MTSPKRLAAMGGGLPPTYIEDVFSTWLYTGNGSTQTITNGIDLAGKGGLVWLKARNQPYDNTLIDTARGNANNLTSNSTSAQYSVSPGYITFGSSGFTLPNSGNIVNDTGLTMASWTFRKQPKFFDVVTYTGDGTTTRNISHALGSAPGCMIVRRYDDPQSWSVYHRSLSSTANILQLNSTAAQASSPNSFASTAPTSSVFTVGVSLNAEGGLYVAYLFAHNAGGFGLTGTDNVISCGSYTGTGALNNQITLGYEPQLVLVKAASISGESWWMLDNMRGMPVQNYSGAVGLRPNTSNAEVSPFGFYPTATGFVPADTGGAVNQSGVTYIYIAIRRGPMRTPTSGTSVYAANFGSDVTTYTTNFPLDMAWDNQTTGVTKNTVVGTRLIGSNALSTSETSAEFSGYISSAFFQSNTDYRWNLFGNDCATYAFRRAPGFFDVVCYTGTGVAGRTVSHGLAAVPQLIIVKQRSSPAANWIVYSAALGPTKGLYLDLAAGQDTADWWNNTAPTTSVFSVGPGGGMAVNDSGATYVAYLFASCPGVSSVGSYTGNGSSQTINCGFTGGARFVMIKRTNSTGNWMVVDTARGLVAAGDPTLYLNSTAAQVTGADWLDPASSGFIVNQEGTMNANVNGASYIFLAIS